MYRKNILIFLQYFNKFICFLQFVDISLIYQTNKNNLKLNKMQTLNTILLVAQLSLFAAFLFNVVRLVINLTTNK